jgi:hypothetical protein
VHPIGHSTDHRAIVATFTPGKQRRMQQYRKRFERFPLRPTAPLTEEETLFEELKESCDPIPARKRPPNAWISDATWDLVDRRARLDRSGKLTQQSSRQLGRQIKASLKTDRAARAAKAASNVESHLNSGLLEEAWRELKGWYRIAEDKAPKPCYESLQKQTQERIDLYARVAPPGQSIPINVEPTPVDDSVPDDAEIRSKVKGMSNGRAGGASKLRAEDLKSWLHGMELEEKKPEGHEGAGDRWRLFVRLIQTIWRTGTIPQQMLWTIIVLIPKGGGGYRGIGLLEPFWKVIEILIDGRLAAIPLHDCLHGSLPKRGTGTAILEAKLAQQLAYMEQFPLYGIFIDLRKAYDAMDRGRCLEILRDYGVGPNIVRLLETFWDLAVLVCRAMGRYGEPFQAERGVTQGGPVSPRLFNIMVDAIVREWFRQVFGDEVARDGVGEAVRLFIALFYVDDGWIASRDPEQLQHSFGILIGLFERVGLFTNVDKTKAMICIPGRIRTKLSTEVYERSRFGFCTAKAWESRRVECDICGANLSASSLSSHLETQHDVYRSRVLNRDLVDDRPTRTYFAPYSMASGKFKCPVPGCVGEAATKWNMRRHFLDRHPKDLVVLPGEGLLPRCSDCGMQTSHSALAGKHRSTSLCRSGTDRQVQREAAVRSERAIAQKFTAYDEELENVEVFKYLGRLIAMDDIDNQAIRSNMKKARKCWARISRVLRADNASPRVCGMFYKATVQAVLLYGSESWNLTPSLLRRLEGFHVKAAWRMAAVNKPRKDAATGTWTYPVTEEVLEEVGLYSMEHYIRVRRDSIAQYIATRPILELCRGAERRRGSSPRHFWWEQPMSLVGARLSDSSSVTDGDSE